MTGSRTFELSVAMSASDVLRLAIAAERKRFLHGLHIYLAVAGLLIAITRLANQFDVPFLSVIVGWPTSLCFLLGGAVCTHALYLLLRKPSGLFLTRHVSVGTRQALAGFNGDPAVAHLAQLRPLTVADIWKLQAEQG